MHGFAILLALHASDYRTGAQLNRACCSELRNLKNTLTQPTSGRLPDKEDGLMKRLIVVTGLVTLLFVLTTSAVFAGGGQVRGENGQGSVVQNQVQDPPPFQP